MIKSTGTKTVVVAPSVPGGTGAAFLRGLNRSNSDLEAVIVPNYGYIHYIKPNIGEALAKKHFVDYTTPDRLSQLLEAVAATTVIGSISCAMQPS